MKQVQLALVLGVVSLVLGVGVPAQPAKAFGDWLSRDSTCTEPRHPRVHHRTVRKRIVERPGIYRIERRPGVYGWRKVKVRTRSGHVVWRKKRILLKPYENVARYHKPKLRWVRKRQRIVAPAPQRPRGAWPDGC